MKITRVATHVRKMSLSVLLLLMPMQILSQEPGADPVLNFLLQAQDDVSLLLPDISSYGDTLKPSWIDQPEARISSGSRSGSGATENQNSFALRVRPVFGSQRAAEQNLGRLTIEQQQLNYEAQLNDALQLRYGALLAMMTLQSDDEFTQQQIAIADAELEYEQSLVQTNAFDAERLQQIELNLFQLQQQLSLTRERLTSEIQQASAATSLAQYLSADADWLMPFEEMIQNALATSLSQGNLDLRASRQNLAVQSNVLSLRFEEEQLKREKAERYPPIRFVELKYARQSPVRRSEAETTLSFSIPFGGRRNAFRKEERDIAEAKTDLLISQREAARLIEQERSRLRLNLHRASGIEQTIEYLDEKLQDSQGIGSPRLILSLRKERLQQQRLQWDLHLAAMEDYINLLHTSGRLVTRPLQNWLMTQR